MTYVLLALLVLGLLVALYAINVGNANLFAFLEQRLHERAIRRQQAEGEE